MSFLNPINKSQCLEEVCEANFQKLFQLIPDLRIFKDKATGIAPCNTLLYVQIIEQTAYTLTIELSHCFSKKPDELMVPEVRIRLYLDAQLAEVISDHARASVNHVFKDFGLSREIMNYKWRLNFFLQKWLDHCLTKGYRFTPQAELAVDIS
ncbi:MAG: DUF1249 domain-containing protein [Methyloglobulus sp.]|nr:DUF1249 domain-containing protein [Methyloglobulus sp.]